MDQFVGLLRSLSAAFEKLHGAFVAFGGGQSAEGAEVPAFARAGIEFARVKAVSAGFQFSNHTISPADVVGERSICDGKVNLHRFHFLQLKNF
jgi:hypothetical protein